MTGKTALSANWKKTTEQSEQNTSAISDEI